nr:immunoglobulin heavy chain junction region [Macaca mulatta]
CARYHGVEAGTWSFDSW